MKSAQARAIFTRRLKLHEDPYRSQVFYYLKQDSGAFFALPPVVTLPTTVAVDENKLVELTGFTAGELEAIEAKKIRPPCALLKLAARLTGMITAATGMDAAVQEAFYRTLGTVLRHIGRLPGQAPWLPAEQNALQDVRAEAARWAGHPGQPLQKLGEQLSKLLESPKPTAHEKKRAAPR